MPQKTVVKKSASKPLPKVKPKKQYEPVFDLYRDGLTQGSISRFLDCREQFRLGTVFGWKPKVNSGATAFGSAFHDVLASIQHSNDGAKLLTLDEAIDKHYKSLTDKKNLTAVQTEEVCTMLALVRVFIERYQKRWVKEDSKLKWIEREKVFNMEVQVADVPPLTLRGRRDGAFRKPDGIWLHETKTKGRIDEEGLAASLPHDPQTMLYCYSLKEDYKETPKGTLYDVIRTTSLQPRKGRGKAPVPETSTDYIRRVTDDLGERQDWYFMRWNVSITQKDLDVWEERFLIPVLTQIVEWWNSIKDFHNPWTSPLHFMRPGAFWTIYGRTDLFHALTKGQYFDLEQRKIVYPELVD